VECNALLSFVCFCEDMFGDGSTAETCSIAMNTAVFVLSVDSLVLITQLDSHAQEFNGLWGCYILYAYQVQ
jgi:hypothetical protein